MVKFQFSYLQAGTVNHSSKKQAKTHKDNPFCLNLIEKKS